MSNWINRDPEHIRPSNTYSDLQKSGSRTRSSIRSHYPKSGGGRVNLEPKNMELDSKVNKLSHRIKKQNEDEA